MANGEKKKNKTSAFFSSAFAKQAIASFSLKAESRQYAAFRTILLLVAATLVWGHWYLFDRNENYRIGYPSDKTYFALTSTRYEDRAAIVELRQRAAARIVDVMVQDEKIVTEVNRRFEVLKQGDYASLFNAQLLDLLKKLPEGSRQ